MSVPLPMTVMSISMDLPLNQAHKQERIAEAHLQNGQWDDAEERFMIAANLMRKAMEGVTSKKVTIPLQMQADRLEKMKAVIDIKRKEANSSNSPQASPAHGQKHTSPKYALPDPVSPGDKSSLVHFGIKESGKPNLDSSIAAKRKPFLHTKNRVTKKENHKWQVIPNNIQHLIEERETDSLLQFLNLPIEAGDAETDPLNSSSTCKKIPKNEAARIEEYRTQLNLLRSTALQLCKALEDTERENKTLRQNVQELQSEVWDLTERLAHLQDEADSPHKMNYIDDDYPNLGVPSDKFTTDPMIASIIVQPESFFEHERTNEVSSELQEAAGDDAFSSKGQTFESVPHSELKIYPKNRKTQSNATFKSIKPDTTTNLDNSIKYEELDEETNEEVLENLFDPSDFVSSPLASLHEISIAGLPPLSPVHFELDEKEDIL